MNTSINPKQPHWDFSILAFFGLNIAVQIVLFAFFGTKIKLYTIAMHLIWILWIIFIIRSRQILPFSIIGSAAERRKWLWLLSLIPFIILIAGVAAIIIPHIISSHPELALKTLGDSEQKSDNPFFLIFTSLIAAPLIEEFIFRGLVLNCLMQKTSNFKAIIYSSLLFGFMHAQSLGIVQFFLGVFLAIAYVHTECLIVPIAMHMIWNLSLTSFLILNYQPVASRINVNDLEQLATKLSALQPVIWCAITSSLLVLSWILIRYFPSRAIQSPYLLNSARGNH